MNYYNEFDPNAAAWLRQLIADKQIPNGTVDDRSITEVTPNDLKGFTQCHFFAGVGGWSLALRLAGVPENRRVWTASLPCQPFSTAGKQLGTDDERHLAPVFLELVRQCNPATLLGEQVASKIARTQWLPGIRLEFEALGYSFGAVDLCSPCAGEIGEGRIVRGDQESWERIIIGKPHIRQRLYWMANRTELRRGEGSTDGAGNPERASEEGAIDRYILNGSDDRMADSERIRREVEMLTGEASRSEACNRQADELGSDELHRWVGDGWKRVSFAADCLGGDDDEPGDECSICGLTYADDCECLGPTHDGYEYAERDGVLYARRVADSEIQRRERLRDGAAEQSASPRNSDIGTSSSDHVLLPCRDGKTRRTQSGIFKMAYGLSLRVVPSGNQVTQEKEIVDAEPNSRIGFNHATPTSTNPRENMPLLQQKDGQKEVSIRGVGVHTQLQTSEVLRENLHGKLDGRDNQSAEPEEQSQAVNQVQGGDVREMRVSREAGSSPQGLQPGEQRPCQFGDFMFVLSHENPLGRMATDNETFETLQGMWQSIKETRDVPKTFSEMEEAWRSLSGSESLAKWNNYCEGKLLIHLHPVFIKGIFPLVAGIPRGVVPSGDPGAPEYANATAEARAARLKGYGNAIQIDTAVLFIQTAFEALADTTP